MAENRPNPLEMDVTVTYHISSIEALAKDIAGAMLAFVELKSDIERKVFVSNLFSGLYKPTNAQSEEAPTEDAPAEEAPTEDAPKPTAE